jgi:GST-like protein
MYFRAALAVDQPAVQQALAMKQKHTFKADLDDETRKALFPQNAVI